MIREIVKYPDPVLQKPCELVTEFGAPLQALVDDMFDSMYAAKGIGLAAPQIGVSKQVTVIDLSFEKDEKDRIVLVNPEIIFRDGKQYEQEGCLSLPEIHEKVSRAAHVRVRAQNVQGDWFELHGTELLSRAFQHEIDHLHGILFFSRVSMLKRDLILRRIRKMQRDGEW
jgi:peptide deformylase